MMAARIDVAITTRSLGVTIGHASRRCSAAARAAVAGACGGACRWAARRGRPPRALPNREAFSALVESGRRIRRARLRRRRAGRLVRDRAARRLSATGSQQGAGSHLARYDVVARTACSYRRAGAAAAWRRALVAAAVELARQARRDRDRGLSAGVGAWRSPGRGLRLDRRSGAVRAARLPAPVSTPERGRGLYLLTAC